MDIRTPRRPSALLALVLFAIAAPSWGEIYTAAEVSHLITSVRADLAASAGDRKRTDALDRGFERAWHEADPARREAMLSVWLRDWVGPEPPVEPDTATLERLLDFEPVVRTRHHDHPEHRLAVFQVAGLARNRLTEQQIRFEARALPATPDALIDALGEAQSSITYRAALRVIDHADELERQGVRSAWTRLGAKQTRDAAWAGATLDLVERGVLPDTALIDLVMNAPASIALQALRRIERLDAEERLRAVKLAIERPDLGGIALDLAGRSTDARLLDALWKLLDEPARGADAALALARHDELLVARVDERFDAGTERARLRMLLALRLRNTPDSRALLDRLSAGRLQTSERTATEAWR